MPSEEQVGDSLGDLSSGPSFDFNMNDETGNIDIKVADEPDNQAQSDDSEEASASPDNTRINAGTQTDNYQKRYTDLQSQFTKVTQQMSEYDKAIALMQQREEFLLALLQNQGQPIPSEEDWADTVSDKRKFDEYNYRQMQAMKDSLKEEVREYLKSDPEFAKVELTMGLQRTKAQMQTDGVDPKVIMPLLKFAMKQNRYERNFDDLYDEIKSDMPHLFVKQPQGIGGSTSPSMASEAAIKARANRLNIERNAVGEGLPKAQRKDNTDSDPRNFNRRAAIMESIDEAWAELMGQ